LRSGSRCSCRIFTKAVTRAARSCCGQNAA
jgi:hypothetical protein